MDGDVRQLKTATGKTQWMFTIGKTTYFRTNWADVIDILNSRRDDLPVIDAGYGQGRYMGD